MLPRYLKHFTNPWLFLVGLYLLNVFLRLPGVLNQGLPPYLFCDENMFTLEAYEAMINKTYIIKNQFRAGGFNIYPILFLGKFLNLFTDLNHTQFIVMSRLFYAALLNPIALFYLFFSTAKLFPKIKSAPYLAALAFTASPVIVGVSRQAYPDHCLIAFTAMFLYHLIEIYQSPRTWRPYLMAGVAAGFAISTKYTALLFAVPFCATLALRIWFDLKEGTPCSEVRNDYLKRVSAYGIVCLALLAIWNFSAFLHPKNFRADWSFNLHNYKRGLVGVNWTGIGYYAVVLFLLPFGLIGVPVLFVGVGRVLKERNWLAISLLTFPVFMFLYMGATVWLTIDRNMIPAVAYLVVFQGLGLALVYEWVKGRTSSSVVSAAAVAFLLAEPATKMMYLHIRDWRTDSRVLAHEWIEQNIPQGSRVLHNEFCSGSSPAAGPRYRSTFNDNVKFDNSSKEPFDYYVFNSWWKGPLDGAFRRGMLLQPDYSMLHFYNIADREPFTLSNNNKAYPDLGDHYRIIKDFDSSGPVIVVIKKMDAPDR